MSAGVLVYDCGVCARVLCSRQSTCSSVTSTGVTRTMSWQSSGEINQSPLMIWVNGVSLASLARRGRATLDVGRPAQHTAAMHAFFALHLLIACCFVGRHMSTLLGLAEPGCLHTITHYQPTGLACQVIMPSGCLGLS